MKYNDIECLDKRRNILFLHIHIHKVIRHFNENIILILIQKIISNDKIWSF